MSYEIGIAPCQTYDRDAVYQALKTCLEATDGLSWLKPGMKIAIKANLVTASKPDAAIVSHPIVLWAMTKLLFENGAADVVIGDSPGGPFNETCLNRVYRTINLNDAVAEGARLNQNFNQTTFSFPEGKIMKQLTCTSWLFEADAVINVCKLKTHGMMYMSANVKNLFGCIPGTMKPEYHYRFPKHEDFADMLVDLNEFLRPVLYVTDAIVGMEGNGPTAGTPRKIGCLLCSEKPYALDILCAKIIGLDPFSVPTNLAAKTRGLGSEDPTINADPSLFFVEDYKNITQKADILFTDRFPAFFSPFMKLVLESRPRVKKKECIGCKKCATICPAKAIKMVKKKPVIDRGLCIRCFCCQEFCPKGAMKVHRSAIASLLQHEKQLN